MKVDIRRPVSSGFATNNGRVYTIEEAPAYRRMLPDTQYSRTLPCAQELVSTHNYYHTYKSPNYTQRFLESQGQLAFTMQAGEITQRTSCSYNRFETPNRAFNCTNSGLYRAPPESDTLKITSFGCGFRRNIKQPQTTVPWQKPTQVPQSTYQTVNQVFQSYVRQDKKSWRAMPTVSLK